MKKKGNGKEINKREEENNIWQQTPVNAEVVRRKGEEIVTFEL